MVEAGRRSLELPLTKQLHVLRRARSLRDPLTSSSTKHGSLCVWESPVREKELMSKVKEECKAEAMEDTNTRRKHRCDVHRVFSEQEAEKVSPNEHRHDIEESPVTLHNWQNEGARDYWAQSDFMKNEGRTKNFMDTFEGEYLSREMKSSSVNGSREVTRLDGDHCERNMSLRKVPCREDSVELQASLKAFSMLTVNENRPLHKQRGHRGSGTGIPDSQSTSLVASEKGDEDCQSSIQDSYDEVAFSGDDEMDAFSFQRRRCGIPCYWYRSPRNKRNTTCSMPKNLSKGLHNSFKRRGYRNLAVQKDSEFSPNDPHRSSKFDFETESLPLLTDGADSSTAFSVEDQSEKWLSDFGEFSWQTFGRKKRRGRGREKLELALASDNKKLAVYREMHRNLSQKYRPRSFEELVGQNLVVQSLVNAVLKDKVAPAYLFQGPRGTGKTSTARIFAAALNCLSIEELRPCGFCTECSEFATGRSANPMEVDAANNSKVQKLKSTIRNAVMAPPLSRFKIFIIDECHMLTSETWALFLKYLEEPPAQFVFIFVTSDPSKIPTSAISRCQRYLFPKIKESEIVSRLQKLAVEESLDVDSDALDLIAIKSEGSLRDAEMMLDQLSLLGERITLSLVHDLTGVVSDEKLLDLLELALSADAASTVRRVRELIGSGIEPMALMSQLATLIMDILASSSNVEEGHQKEILPYRHALTENVLERLRRALRILSEAEKQLRTTNDKTTWLTAALLQFAPSKSLLSNSASSSVFQSPLRNPMERRYLYLDSPRRQKWDKQRQYDIHLENFNMGVLTKPGAFAKNRNAKMLETSVCNDKKNQTSITDSHSPLSISHSANVSNCPPGSNKFERIKDSPEEIDTPEHSGPSDLVDTEKRNLDEVWRRAVEECQSKNLRNLLHNEGKLVSIVSEKGTAIAHIEFVHQHHISRAKRSWKSIANSLQQILGCKVQVVFRLSSLAVNDGNTELELAQLREGPRSCQSLADSKAYIEVEKDRPEKGANTFYEAKESAAAFKNDDVSTQSQFPNSIDAAHEGLKSSLHDSKAELHSIHNSNNENHNLNGSKLERVSSKAGKSLSQNHVIEEKEKGSSLNTTEDRNQYIVSQDSFGLVASSAEEMKLACAGPHTSIPNNNLTIKEDMEAKSSSEHGRVLCWKLPKSSGYKVREHKQGRKRKSDIVTWVVLCARAKD